MGMCSQASTPIQLCNSSPSLPNGCPFVSNETSIRSPFDLTMWTLLKRVALRLPSPSGLNLAWVRAEGGVRAAWARKAEWGHGRSAGVGRVGAWAEWGASGRGRSRGGVGQSGGVGEWGALGARERGKNGGRVAWAWVERERWKNGGRGRGGRKRREKNWAERVLREKLGG
ncbi:hypothetical protein TIFTF001_031721 [Ficus carica]|uniref:Uncharacterized protein n=1 Tax=Ficus carica TaxID=3494 RepID=A0AA88DV81_FICCA|nr:hypothetical protein TIFTF001_031721 [Ficus carica]